MTSIEMASGCVRKLARIRIDIGDGGTVEGHVIHVRRNRVCLFDKVRNAEHTEMPPVIQYL